MDFGWIDSHIGDNISKLWLKYGREHGDDILQIEMRRKHHSKFSDVLEENPHLIFPSSLSAEQSTSCTLARFHSTLINQGDSVADLTAGLGIDAMAMSKVASSVVAVERDESIANALRINAPNINIITGDCRDIVEKWVQEENIFDTVFIDPARRDSFGGRVFALDSCEPNVLQLLDNIKKITNKLIVKASPMLDISHTIKELSPYVDRIIILGTTTECKELVAVCDFRTENEIDPLICAVTLSSDTKSEFIFTRSQEMSSIVNYGIPKVGDVVFDPFPAVMKAAPIRLLGEKFGIKKLGPNTHLWYAESFVEGFPGTTFRVVDVQSYMSKNIKRYASKYPKVSVTSRNFDISSDALRNKLHVSEGPLRLFAVNAIHGNKLLITCERL